MAAQPIPPDQIPAGKEVATLGGGCFWCLEAVYDDLAGVESVESGYMGGRSREPSYEEVCGGDSGHAEVVRITFDPAAISFREILRVFFVIHDPTTLNRQGNDVGTQYRSAIFYHSPEQQKVAAEVIAELAREKVYDDRIVTEVTPGQRVLDGRALSSGVLPQQSRTAVLHVGRRAEGAKIPQALPRAGKESGALTRACDRCGAGRGGEERCADDCAGARVLAGRAG